MEVPVNMPELKTKTRKKLPDKEFAGPGQVFISEATYRAVPLALDVVPIGAVRIGGDGETQEAFLLRGLVREPSPRG